ncbi:hypothetical protein ONZ45_g757 [Pleurotus djamor]|nr:hypothetical protein ONZ45_g757 [Pleurotus djamor]
MISGWASSYTHPLPRRSHEQSAPAADESSSEPRRRSSSDATPRQTPAPSPRLVQVHDTNNNILSSPLNTDATPSSSAITSRRLGYLAEKISSSLSVAGGQTPHNKSSSASSSSHHHQLLHSRPSDQSLPSREQAASPTPMMSSTTSKAHTSPSKPMYGRTYDTKLVQKEMHRLGSLAPNLPPALSPAPVLPNPPSAPLSSSSSDPWTTLHIYVLPLFNGEPLRIPIEDLNVLVRQHIEKVIPSSPSKALATLENHTLELISSGMVTLNAKLSGVDDEKLLSRLVEVWNFFWDQVLPYIEGVMDIYSLLVRLQIPNNKPPGSPPTANRFTPFILIPGPQRSPCQLTRQTTVEKFNIDYGITVDALLKRDRSNKTSKKPPLIINPDFNKCSWSLHPKGEDGLLPSRFPPLRPSPQLVKVLSWISSASFVLRGRLRTECIDALLPNVRPKSSRKPPLDRFLHALHTCVMSLPPIAPEHPLTAARKLTKRGVAVPYSVPQPTEETNWKVAFEKPSEINVVGSWANNIGVKGKDGVSFGVDIALEMPHSLFQEKDYLNGRFFHKRAFYLAALAAGLTAKKSGLDVSVSYESSGNDPRLTKLVLVPNKDDSPNDFSKLNARVYIIPTLSLQSPIPLHRLSPTHSNLRYNSSSGDDGPSNPSPTPLYNTALLSCMTPRPYLLLTHALTQIPAFNDAVALLRIWANQRGYGPGTKPSVRGFQNKGCWWSFVLSVVMNGEETIQGGKFTNQKPLGKGLSSYQLFKAGLDFLAKHDFEASPVFLKTKDGHKFEPDEYVGNHSAVFVDGASLVNLVADIPVGSLRLLRYDAQRTLEILDHSPLESDPFTEVFLKDQRDAMARCDVVLRVDISSAKYRKESVAMNLDHGSSTSALLASMDAVIREALGNRCKASAILHPSSSPRPLTQAVPATSELTHILIALVLDSQHAFRLVDHGPAADESDTSVVERFREFWGDKAELRRFKDGRIVESVVWDVQTPEERSQVPAMIVEHILRLHFGVRVDQVQTWQKPFDALLKLPPSISSVYQQAGVAAGFKGALAAFDQVVKNIKALDDKLPLSILNISPSSSFLRYTSVFAPVPLPASISPLLPPSARYLPHLEFIIEFEKSTRWPDDLSAIQKIKLAFFERIATALMASVNGLSANVVVGDGPTDSDIQDKARLELITKDGWAFSARIWHEREAELLDRVLDKKPLLPHIVAAMPNYKPPTGKDIREAQEAKELYLRRFIHGPRHHRAIAALCHQFSAFAGTVRLVKRWFSAHWLLGGHVSEEAVELLCASVFVGDGKNVGIELEGDESNSSDRPTIPATKERGFAMVIDKLRSWEWMNGMFVSLYGRRVSGGVGGVDGDGDAVMDGVPDTTSPSRGSKIPPSHKGVWRLRTVEDPLGNVWTSHGPDAVVARRIHALSEATWGVLQSVDDGNLDTKSLFIHPINDYDFLIKLNPKILPRYAQNVSPDPAIVNPRSQSKYANLAEDALSTKALPGFDPAQLFFNDLKRIYADTFMLFHDPFGGTDYGGVWVPTLRDSPRPFRVLGGFSSAPTKLASITNVTEASPTKAKKSKDKDLVALNDQAILSEIERIGQGLVKEIVVQVQS